MIKINGLKQESHWNRSIEHDESSAWIGANEHVEVTTAVWNWNYSLFEEEKTTVKTCAPRYQIQIVYGSDTQASNVCVVNKSWWTKT